MRIGIVTEEYWPSAGPIADHVRHFAREARRLGHAVKIFTGAMPELSRAPRRGAASLAGGRTRASVEPRSPAEEADVVRLARSRRLLGQARSGSRVAGGIGLGTALRKALALERLDVIHLHGPLTPVLPLLALHHASGPVVGTFHAPYRPGLLGRLFEDAVQRYLDRLDATVVTSPSSVPSLPERIRGELRVIPPGVDVDRLARGCRIRRFQDGKLNVLFSGPLEQGSGLEPLLAAVHRAWRHTEVRLLIIGTGSQEARCRARVPGGMEEDVVFARPDADARPDWFATADVCCVPGASQLQILEAMAAGRPVLAADLEPNRELIRHGREGELLPPADSGAWARCLFRLGQEPARIAAYGDRGRATAQHYSWPGVARDLLNVYRSIGVKG